MKTAADFKTTIDTGYETKGDYIVLGTAIYNNEALPNTPVKAPLKTFNRHGLIAGATGTGKTKTLQIIAESLSAKGVPTLLMDIKGDLSGIAKAGISNARIEERQQKIGIPFNPQDNPVEFLSLSNEQGVRLRATVSEFGPVLFSKILDLNDTQAGVVVVLFKYCDDKNFPLLDLKDFKKILNYATEEGQKEMEAEYGKISSATTSTILRKIIELEQQGAEKFFGERSFEVDDLVKIDENGKGKISIVRLTDIQDKPKLFSTFMLCLLAEIYATFPEEGDMDRPKLVIFIDEAHLIFNEASKALLDQIETIIKLIRSKGVGVFFCTQNPSDVPDAVLSQLGMKVQHALRAFTAKDRKMIKLTAENYPISDYYDTETLLTSLGMGEAVITVLSEKGTPTPLAATLLMAPNSRMDVLTAQEIQEINNKSFLVKKYNEVVDRESAYEMLTQKINNYREELPEKSAPARAAGRQKEEKSAIEEFAGSAAGKVIIKEVTRGLLGVLGLSTSRSRSRNKGGLFF